MATAMAMQDGSSVDLNHGMDSEEAGCQDPWRLPALEELEAAQDLAARQMSWRRKGGSLVDLNYSMDLQEIELNDLALESKQERFNQETSWGRKGGAAVDLNHGMDLEEARRQRRRQRWQEIEQNDLDATQELITLKDSWSNQMMAAKGWAPWALRKHKEAQNPFEGKPPLKKSSGSMAMTKMMSGGSLSSLWAGVSMTRAARLAPEMP